MTILFAAVLLFTGMTSAATSVTQWGITWTLAHDYTVGQFANGDTYVVADTGEGTGTNVVVTDIDPGYQAILQDGETFHINGNMVNPDPETIGGGHQAYDDRTGTGTYNGALLVDIPITLEAGDSLVSTISWQIGESGCPARYDSNPAATLYHMPRPPLRVAAILTVLSEAPPAGTFRPPYAGTEKPRYNISSLNLSLLPNLAPASGMASASTYNGLVNHAWLDHVTSEQGEWHNPTENMPFYGRDQMSDINRAILALCTNLTSGQKTTLATYVCQVGIDWYYIVKAGGGWGKAAGAMRIGRKWPILFAGTMLDIDEMEAVGTTYGIHDSIFQEDSQVFYIDANHPAKHAATTRTNCTITQEDYNGKTVAIITDSDGGSWWDDDLGGTQPIQSGRGFPGDFWVRVHRPLDVYDIVRASAIHDGDTAKIRVNELDLDYYGLLAIGSGLTVEIQLFPSYLIGDSEWAENYIWRYDQMYYSRGYRISSCKSWPPAMLAALMMGVTNLWGHNCFFEQCDFYMAEQDAGTAQRAQDVWCENMWDLYRDDYTLPAYVDPNEPEPDPNEPGGGPYVLILRSAL